MSEHSAPRLGVLVSSTRPGRIGPSVAEWVVAQVDSTEWEIDLIDLAEMDLPFFNEPKQPSAGDYVLPHTQNWARRVKALDALIIVLPEYNNSYPATIKNALDTLYAEWEGLPVGIVGYGWRGAATSTEHISVVLRRLGTRLVPPVALTFREDLTTEAEVIEDSVGHEEKVTEVAQLYAALHDLVVQSPED